MHTRAPRLVAAGAAALLLVVGAAACGKDDKADSTTTTAKATTTTTEAATTTVDTAAETVRFDKTVQSGLAAVGCYKGAIDGIFGPKTDAAVLAFQEASGLDPDGEVGPGTEAKLREDMAARKVVCTDTTTTTKAPVRPTTTFAPNDAPCTATALLGGLPAEGEKIGTFVCSGGYAAGTLSDGTTKFILQAKNGKWYALDQDPCGSASAGLPPIILQDGCPA
jgi:Putative peptidoglycan binding domain